MSVIAVTNWKGGVGKTTTVVNLGASLAKLGHRVLLVDLDPQASLTIHTGHKDPDSLVQSLADLMDASARRSTIDQDAILQAVRTFSNGVDILPGNLDLVRLEQVLRPIERREYVLRDILASLQGRYDYVLIDCPPSIGTLTDNGLTAADYVLVPVQADYLAMQRLGRLISSIGQLRAAHNPRLQVLGVLMTMVDLRTRHARDTAGVIRQLFQGQIRVFYSMIWLDVRLRDSSRASQSVLDHAPTSRGAQAYQALASEILAILPDYQEDPDRGAVVSPDLIAHEPHGSVAIDESLPPAETDHGPPSGDAPSSEAAPRQVCPFLGLADDRTSHQDTPSREHRCYAVERPMALSFATQQQLCLNRRHQLCSQFMHAKLLETKSATRSASNNSPLGRVRSWFRRDG